MTHTLVITGANRGIGLEFTRQYAAEGWRVYAGCRQPERAEALNRLAAASDGRVSVHPLDVTRATHIQALAAVVGDAPVDLLLNNAGSYGPDSVRFGHTDEAAWIENFRTNVIGPMKMMETLADNVARRNSSASPRSPARWAAWRTTAPAAPTSIAAARRP